VLSVVFLVALGALWLIVFVSAVMRARASAPLTTTERFRRSMDLIAPPMPKSGRWVVVLDSPSRRARAMKMRRAARLARARRRRLWVLVVMLLAAVGTAVAAAIVGDPMWEVHLGLNAALALYVGYLLESKRRREERAVKVRPLRRRREGDWFDSATAAGGSRS
jgi:hypothetical protein